MLTSSNCPIVDIAGHSYSIWKSRAHLKDKIPSKVALSWRGISFHDGSGLLRSFCNDELETSTHLFSSCKIIYSVWQLLYNWLNISVALPQNPLHHYNNHLGMVSDRKGRKAWSIIWLATVWAIYRHQNEVILNKIRPSIKYILDTARVNVWLWIKHTTESDFTLYSDWLAKPLDCLKVTL
ncbi:hypothetical protein Lal_00025824 [Lupinus albus]|nr:hypothetical protein Lal_00025824 [Lupinus albus]